MSESNFDKLESENDEDFVFESPKFCPKCFTTLKDFLDTGFVGCENCYKTFEKEIQNYINSSQFSSYHIGKLYSNNLSNVNEEKLSRELRQAIAEQRFEDCLIIKQKIDKIKENNIGK